MAGKPEHAAGAISFHVLAEIASGATARVDLCRALPPHPRAGSLLAVKRLHPHLAEDPSFEKQFLDEVWMTASLRHPNVVEVVGWGKDDQGSYLAVELVQGVSLHRLMKTIFDTGEQFTERMAVYLGAKICRGLAAAHALRAPNGELLHLVHRDLTPGNVLVGFNGDVKIADFGLAKARQRLTKTLTGMRKGEPTYMPPEQATSDEIDHRADLFSLGVMLFELFAGRRPWVAKNDYEMVQVMSRDPPADLREIRPKIDRELVAVVNRCLEKHPSARFQHAVEIAERFEEWLSLHGYLEGNEEALARFVRRNAMKQMRWFESAVAGELTPSKKVGRDVPPRVPTYTESSRPVPAGPVGRARDSAPEAQRAKNAVEQLKRLAPFPAAVTAKSKPRTPTLDDVDDEDDDVTEVTDVEGQIAAAQRGREPKIGTFDDIEENDEVETLVQSGSAQIEALRANARKLKDHKKLGETLQDKKPKPGYVAPPRIEDEDSDQGTTVNRSSGAARPRAPVIDAPDSGEMPTKPRMRAVGAADISNDTTLKRPAVKPVIPPAPGVPQLAQQGRSQQARPPATAPQAKPKDKDTVRPPPSHAPPGGPPAAPPVAIPPPPASPVWSGAGVSDLTPLPNSPLAAYSPGAARVSSPDDVLVLDRRELTGPLTEEALLVEADRFAIEAVRRAEEAKSAQIRAERKAAAARMAQEAARVAAEAVRLAKTAGLDAANARIAEARALEVALQSGKFPVERWDGGTHSSSAPPSMEPQSAPAQAPVFQASPSQQPPPHAPPQFAGAAIPSKTGSVAPPPYASQPPPAARPATIPPNAAPSPAPQPGMLPLPPPMAIPGRPATVPPPGEPARQVTGPTPPLHISANAAPSPPLGPSGGDDDMFRAQLKPTILGLPPAALFGLAGAGVFAVALLLYYLLG